MPIFWRPQFRIGHDDIDDDHRYLILLINTVELVLRFPEDARNVELALGELRRYAQRHFEREERIQIACGYLHLDQHKLEHRRLLVELDALIERVSLALGDSTKGLEAIMEQSPVITQFLRKWLIDHVIKSDMQLVNLFRKQPVHPSGD